MPKGKLILICQSGGKFLTKDDGSLSYNGGEANALAINPETMFNDLKLKVAELVNMDYKSLSIKYFLPGNKRTLISLVNDKDLKRMYDFHENSVTADVFITGKAGFSRDAFTTHADRSNGIKIAETVPPTPSHNTAVPVSTPAESVVGVNATGKSLSEVQINSKNSPAQNVTDDPTAGSLAPNSPTSTAAKRTSDSPIIFDMNATPADTVKKRRRTASWKNSANGPKIVTVSEDENETRKYPCKERNTRNYNDEEEQLDTDLWLDNLNCTVSDADTKNLSPEKLVASWRKCITGVGQDFKSVYEFRDALQKYAVAHRFKYRLKKNETNRASATCMDEGCSWRIYASWVPSEQVFKIKKMSEPHTCGGESRRAAHPTRSWLVSVIKDRLQESPHLKPKDIANGILQDFGISLNYVQVWRGVEDAREQLLGSYKESYDQLPWFCDKLLEANPGSLVKLFIGDDRKFQRLFISFDALAHGFQNGCRPLIFLDCTPLKSKFHEMFLTATTFDGDDGFFPIAFAIVDSENDENWQWFLEHLRSAISTSEPITFVSDKKKGLMSSVIKVFENAYHGYSIYHLLDDFMKNLKGPFHGDWRHSLPVHFLAAASASRLDGFKISAEQIRWVCSNAYEWIMQIEPEYWLNAAFKGERYQHITFDVSEPYANWIEESRELPITQKLAAILLKMIDLINSRRTESRMWSGKLTPSKEDKLKKEREKALSMRVLFSSETLLEVHGDSTHVVDIDKLDCSCQGWNAYGLPCCHAIAVFNCKGTSVYDYCSSYFSVDRYHLTYSKSIEPVMLDSDKEKAASESESVLPPSSRPASQQKKNYRPQRVLQRTVTCTKCLGVGHNKVSCKETA